MSINAKDGIGSLGKEQYKGKILEEGGMEGTYPLKVPVHAPEAEPGLTKKWLSCSIAWNLRG